MDWEILLKEDIPNVKEDTDTVDPSPRNIDMEKHEVLVKTKDEDIDVKEESVDQRENYLETYDVTKDIRVKDEVGDKNHEELNILHKFKVKEEDNVQDFEDDIEIKEEEVYYDSESGSDLENDPLRLSPWKNDDRLHQHLQLLQLHENLLVVLSKNNPNIEDAKDYLNQLSQLEISGLMLKKFPFVVDSIKKCCRYMFDDEVQEKAALVYNKFKLLFVVPEGQEWEKMFAEKVAEFKITCTRLGFSEDAMLSLVQDPTQSQ